MAMLGRGNRWHFLVLIFLVVALVLTVLQVWSAVSTQRIVLEAIEQAATKSDTELGTEKARQELIGQRIANDSRGNIQTNLAAGLGALSAVIISIAGAILAFFGYLNDREKERIDRADAADKERRDREKERIARSDAQNKDRQDRLAATLSETLSRLVSQESRERVVGAAGLLPFFSSDRADFHLQALAPLVAAARIKGDPPEVRQGIRLAIEQAIRSIKNEVLTQISWRWVHLPDVNLSGLDLRGFDLRDAVLENARLNNAKLDKADLRAAKLMGAQLQKADLAGADLAYADLAGASLAGATMRDANIDSIQVLNLDLEGTDFSGIGASWRGVPWDATANWRQAKFDGAVRAELEAKYGSEAPAIRVLMLMWEAPPLVAGGTWTACYHLVRNLRRRGADVTVVVPWDRAELLPNPFGVDVPIVALGITPPDAAGSIYGAGTQSWSPYGGGPAWSPYGGYSVSGYAGWSGYGGAAPFWSTYARQGGPSAYGGIYSSYAGGRSAGGASLSGSILYRLIGEFRRRLEAYVRDHPPDLIHAHDWVTFDAARAAAGGSIPWAAHFHSTEFDRQPGAEDELTKRIEQKAVDDAAVIIAPSEVTKRRLISAYRAPEARIQVAPNVLSEGAAPTAEMGRFETKRVVFVGRLSHQKGLDRFGAVANAVRRTRSDISFEVFGDGEQRHQVHAMGLNWRGSVGWDERGKAFRAASAIVVPSRFEPFGMVILEAMQHRVPVLYPADSGAAEVLKTGVQVAAGDPPAMAAQVLRLLDSLGSWEETVRAEAQEIEAYSGKRYEDRVIEAWKPYERRQRTRSQ